VKDGVDIYSIVTRESPPNLLTLHRMLAMPSAAGPGWRLTVNLVYRKETRVLVKKRGIPVAAIVSASATQAS
jgi:hypothetical protein